MLNSNDVLLFHRSFYITQNKIKQDNFILKYVKSEKIQRRRPVNGRKPARKMSARYFIRKNITHKLIPVCKKAFLGILNLKKGRVEGVLRRHFETGGMAVENRGGDKKSFDFRSRREAIVTFIKTLQPLETHYAREKIRQRQYLHPELNIKKIWKMYMDQAVPGFGVSFSFFRNIFVTKFNIGFGSPRQDVCSTCLQLTERIKVANTASEKVNLMTELRIHKLRAKAFFKLLQKEEDDEILLSFDCQKNLPLPKIPDQSTYYSRQLYFYNCTIVRGSSRNPFCKDNVFAYTWTEETAHKGSNEICSAVIHCLNNLDLTNVTSIRLMADGCGGQNKNSILLGTMMHWLHSSRTIKRVEIIFPVTGHSFLPSDRIFALTEKQIRKKETILRPQEYIDIVEQHATVYRLGTEVPILDYKTQCRNILKSTQSFHFQISKCKRFILSKGRNQIIKIRGEISYYSDTGTDKTITKRGQSFVAFNPDALPIGVPVQEAKLADVRKLLETHFGENWPLLQGLEFYKRVLSSQNVVGRPLEVSENEDDTTEILNFV